MDSRINAGNARLGKSQWKQDFTLLVACMLLKCPDKTWKCPFLGGVRTRVRAPSGDLMGVPPNVTHR